MNFFLFLNFLDFFFFLKKICILNKRYFFIFFSCHDFFILNELFFIKDFIIYNCMLTFINLSDLENLKFFILNKKNCFLFIIRHYSCLFLNSMHSFNFQNIEKNFFFHKWITENFSFKDISVIKNSSIFESNLYIFKLNFLKIKKILLLDKNINLKIINVFFNF